MAHSHDRAGHHHGPADHPAKGGVIDPVCGMTVDPHTAKHRHDPQGPPLLLLLGRLPHQVRRRSGQISRERRAARPSPCRKARSTPARCIRRSGRSDPAPARSAAWRSNPELVTADTGPNPELADMTRRFWIGLVLTLPVFALEMGSAPRRAARLHRPAACRTGSSSRSPRPSCCGPAGRSSCAAGNRSSRAISTCSR